MKLALTHIGRSLLALYFFLPGVMKFISWDMHVALMETHGMIMAPYLTGDCRYHSNCCEYLSFS